MKALFNRMIPTYVYNIGRLKWVVATCFVKTKIVYDSTKYIYLLLYDIYQHLSSDRIWHKVNF